MHLPNRARAPDLSARAQCSPAPPSERRHERRSPHIWPATRPPWRRPGGDARPPGLRSGTRRVMSDDTRHRTVESDQCAALSEAGKSAADRAVAALRALGRKAYSHQRQALQLQSDGGDVLLCAATGAGKSAAYQAAAYAAPDGTLIVVVQPLVELIHEQTARTNADFAALTRLGWSVGRAMHGAHYGRPSDGAAPAAADAPSAAPLDTPELAEGSLAHAIAYDPQLRIVYVTPEELASKEGGRWTARSAAMQWALAKRKGEILAWAYDECHLVDRWGSTFRDAYLHVEEACTAVDQQRRQTRRSIRMALTATLTLGQHSRLGALLGMRDFVTVCGGDHARSNLHLAVRHPTARELATSADTDAAVAVLTEVLGGMLPTEALSGLVVMYVSYARSAPSVADAINAANFALPSGRRVRAVAFSGQLDAAQRRAVLDEFDVISEDRPLVILVTTCAAGTGMDPNNEITLVVHLRLPPSILDLWQEWGRAGRRRSNAWCVLCVSPAFVVQTLRFASKKPRLVRERLVQELVEVLAVAMLPGCRRRLLDGMVSDVPPTTRCSACDECCGKGECGHWASASRRRDMTEPASSCLDWLQRHEGEGGAPTLSGLVSHPSDSAALPTDIQVRSRLLLTLLADGSLRFFLDGQVWRLCADGPSVRKLAVGAHTVRVSLPAGQAPVPPTRDEARRLALERLHRARVDECDAKKRQVGAMQAFVEAGGDVTSEEYQRVVSRRVE